MVVQVSFGENFVDKGSLFPMPCAMHNDPLPFVLAHLKLSF